MIVTCDRLRSYEYRVIVTEVFEDAPLHPIERWLTIAEFAHRWDFPALRHNHVYSLQQHMADPVAKVALYQKYALDLDKRFALAVEKLVRRTEDPSAEEIGQMGLDNMVKLCTLRGLYSCSPDLKNSGKLVQKIKEMWKIEQCF